MVHADTEIMDAIGGFCERHTVEEVMTAMSKARVPAGPILSTADILKHPQYAER